jgi:hypothetical protein
VLPDGVNPNMLRAQGAIVLENPLDVPFKVRTRTPRRAFSHPLMQRFL